MKFTVSGESGADRLRGKLKEAAARAKPSMKAVLQRDAGNYMVNQVIPLRFRAHGPGWAASRSTSPLMDTKLMSNSNDWRVEGDTLFVGNTRPQARLQNRGGTVVPKNSRFLAIPQSPPLSRTQARVNKPRDFAGAFVLMKGPEGMGLYRKTASYGAGRWTKGVERIFAFVKKVTIKKRPFLYWGAALVEVKDRMKRRLMGRPVGKVA
jgi:hypothetical protein